MTARLGPIRFPVAGRSEPSQGWSRAAWQKWVFWMSDIMRRWGHHSCHLRKTKTYFMYMYSVILDSSCQWRQWGVQSGRLRLISREVSSNPPRPQPGVKFGIRTWVLLSFVIPCFHGLGRYGEASTLVLQAFFSNFSRSGHLVRRLGLFMVLPYRQALMTDGLALFSSFRVLWIFWSSVEWARYLLCYGGTRVCL